MNKITIEINTLNQSNEDIARILTDLANNLLQGFEQSYLTDAEGNNTGIVLYC